MSFSAFPTLEPAFTTKLNVNPSHNIGTLSSGQDLGYYPIPTGRIQSVPGFEPKLDAEIISGGDALYVDPTKTHARINVKGIAKTSEGSIISFSYTGIIHINAEIAAIVGGSPDAKTTAFGQVTTTHSFEVGDAKYKELENHLYVGSGRFLIEEGKIVAEYRVSKVIASTVLD